MLKFSLALVALLTVGCNGGTSYDSLPDAGTTKRDAAIPDPVKGIWHSQLDTDEVLELMFDGQGFELDFLFTTGGTTEMEIDRGTYTFTSSTVELVRTSSSCQGMLPNMGQRMPMAFSKQGSVLTLDMSSSRVVFQLANKLTTTSGVAKIGCFISDGSFTPNPVTKIPESY